jgi:hypothetical protein
MVWGGPVSIDWEYVEERGGLPPGVTTVESVSEPSQRSMAEAVASVLQSVSEQLDELRYGGEWFDAMEVSYHRWTNPRPRVQAAYRRSRVRIPG